MIYALPVEEMLPAKNLMTNDVIEVDSILGGGR